jgi:site-specific recombinase XerC
VLQAARKHLGHIKVQEITRSDVESLVRVLMSRGRSHRTIVRTLGAVRQVLTYGITEGAVAVNVAASVKAPRKGHQATTALKTEQRPRSSGSPSNWTSSARWPTRTNGQRRGGSPCAGSDAPR